MEEILKIAQKIKENQEIEQEIKKSLELHLIIVYQYLKEFKIKI